MVMTSFLVACAALVLNTIHLRRSGGGEDLDGPPALLPAPPAPVLPGPTATAPAPAPVISARAAVAPEFMAPIAEPPTPVGPPMPQVARVAARRGRNNGFARFSPPTATITTRQTTT